MRRLCHLENSGIIYPVRGRQLLEEWSLNLARLPSYSCSITSVIKQSPQLDLFCSACLQILPVAASLLSLSALSVDRYASVKQPRAFTQLRPRRHAMIMTMIFVWGGAALTSSPAVVMNLAGTGGRCEGTWTSPVWRTSFTVCHLGLVYLLPCLTVAVCHFAVGHKLCEVSLTAAAARGQLPLPMPILRRPKHVIIVASLANDAPSKVKRTSFAKYFMKVN